MQRKIVRLGLGLMALFLGSQQPVLGQQGRLGAIDLMKADGVAAVKGEWRYADVTTGVGAMNNEIEPKAHGEFDDSKWEVIKPETLGQARGAGNYSWCWYRLKATIPEEIGGKKFEGGPVWFQTIVDDYGEIWVDGAIDRAFGKSGRGAVTGFNTRNRVRLQKLDKVVDNKRIMRDAKPGDVFQIAVLGINSPLGNPPGNKIFLRSPTNLEFYGPDAPEGGADTPKTAPPPTGTKVGEINLMSKEGAEQVKGAWRRHPVTVHTGTNKNGIEPKAHGPFDDAKWEVVEDPATMSKPYGPGKFSMAWYRIKITLPEKVGNESVEGTAVWFKTTVDDYGEIWVDGKIDLAFGMSGRGAVSGFNTPNEVRLTDSAKAGQTIQISVLAINSPFGNPPGNFIFFRNAGLTFYKK
jgi:hypothetical protein